MLKKEYIFIYIACHDVVEARKIAGYCVSERMAASANIIPGMESFYWWDGTVNAETESVLILKTVSTRFKEIEEAVRKLHSYECPCICALPVSDGFADYLNWMNEITRR
tara:strand:+ start:173 stop:499 length:327 start_codon:yes stop_codon:yes gene_type:complete